MTTCGTVEQTRTIEIGTLRRVCRPARPQQPISSGSGPSPGAMDLSTCLSRSFARSRFGGQRFYFVCVCGRTVEKLHAFGDRPWRCRHCYNLTYATRQAVPPSHLHGAKDPRAARRGSPSMLDAPAETQGDASEAIREASETARCGYTTGFWHDVRILRRAARKEMMYPEFAIV